MRAIRLRQLRPRESARESRGRLLHLVGAESLEAPVAELLRVATAKLKTLEKDLAKLQTQRKNLVAQMAVIRPASKPPTAAALTAVIERHLKAGDLEFGAKAPKKEDILTQTEVNKRPVLYTAIVLKSDPTHVIIKKVLTGGFVPAKPGDGTYSKPVSLKP